MELGEGGALLFMVGGTLNTSPLVQDTEGCKAMEKWERLTREAKPARRHPQLSKKDSGGGGERQ